MVKIILQVITDIPLRIKRRKKYENATKNNFSSFNSAQKNLGIFWYPQKIASEKAEDERSL